MPYLSTATLNRYHCSCAIIKEGHDWMNGIFASFILAIQPEALKHIGERWIMTPILTGVRTPEFRLRSRHSPSSPAEQREGRKWKWRTQHFLFFFSRCFIVICLEISIAIQIHKDTSERDSSSHGSLAATGVIQTQPVLFSQYSMPFLILKLFVYF